MSDTPLHFKTKQGVKLRASCGHACRKSTSSKSPNSGMVIMCSPRLSVILPCQPYRRTLINPKLYSKASYSIRRRRIRTQLPRAAACASIQIVPPLRR